MHELKTTIRRVRGAGRLALWGSVTAYRALFGWASPQMIAGTLLAVPLSELVFFVLLARAVNVADDRFYVIGNGLWSCTVTCVYGGTMAIANERRYGTLPAIMLSPRSRTLVFLGRGLPYVLSGLFTSGFVLSAAALLFHVKIPGRAVPVLLLAMLAAAFSCSALGLAMGACGLRFRDVWLVSNSATTLLLIPTGVSVPPDSLPAWLREAGNVLPLTHAVRSARAALTTSAQSPVVMDLVAELAVGCGYAMLTAALMRIMEANARRGAALDAW